MLGDDKLRMKTLAMVRLDDNDVDDDDDLDDDGEEYRVHDGDAVRHHTAIRGLNELTG